MNDSESALTRGGCVAGTLSPGSGVEGVLSPGRAAEGVLSCVGPAKEAAPNAPAQCTFARGFGGRSGLAQRMLAATSKGAQRPAALALADGTVFFGRACGAEGEATGEICFNTSLEGYFEVLTDPSYAGQIVTMTYPQCGNYGVNADDAQASRPALCGLVVRDLCTAPANWRAQQDLRTYLHEAGVVAIEGVDTRALTRHVRDFGAQPAVISTCDLDVESLRAKAAAAPSIVGVNLAATVSCKKPYGASSRSDAMADGASMCRDAAEYEENGAMADGAFTRRDAAENGESGGVVNVLPASHAFALKPVPASRFRVVAYDCGIKRGILQGLVRAGCDVTVVPWNTPAKDVLALCPDGVFLSNGPGDPDAVDGTFSQVQKLVGNVPLFGICLGHQMLCLAAGARMEKLKYGHRGGNQPVMNLLTRRVEVTAQNHGFGLVFSSLGRLDPALSGGISQHVEDLRFWAERGIAPIVRNPRFGRVRLTHVNLNDGTPEGVQFLDVPAFSVQYHPEASPGPTDASYLFAAFARLMERVEKGDVAGGGAEKESAKKAGVASESTEKEGFAGGGAEKKGIEFETVAKNGAADYLALDSAAVRTAAWRFGGAGLQPPAGEPWGPPRSFVHGTSPMVAVSLPSGCSSRDAALQCGPQAATPQCSPQSAATAAPQSAAPQSATPQSATPEKEDQHA